MRWPRARTVGATVLVLAIAVCAGLVATAAAGASPVPLVMGGARPSMPSISGSQVVWADKYDGNWDLFRYDGIAGTTSRLTQDAADQSMPSVSGSRVAYVDYATGNGDIVVRDLITGLSTRFAVAGDQTHPTLSGDWLAWEDHSTRSPRIAVRNLVSGATYSLGADGSGAERPRISGDVLVWEDHRASSLGRLDPDVWALRLSEGTSLPVAASDVTEYYPDTNGRYVVWSQRTSEGYSIRGYDMATGTYLDIASDPGEQTTPAITDATVYWVHNIAGQPLHVDTYDLASGQRSPMYGYTAGDIVGIAASGGNAAWLESAGSRMRVRVLLGDGLAPLARLAALSPISSVVSSVRLALLSTGGDETAPAVTSASIARGAQQVSRSGSLSVYFSEPLAVSSVSANTVRVVDAETGVPVPATVRYSALTNAVTVQPSSALAAGVFTLEVDPTITDVSGNALGTPTDITFSTASATTDVAKPTKPGLSDVRTSGTDSVRLTWTASIDDFLMKDYQILRRSTPMSATDYSGSEVVATVPSSTLTTVVSAKGDERSKSFTYYYVVVARDSVDHTSTPSTNFAPNPHGTYSATAATSSCLRCHSVHGGGLSSPMLGARSAAACYACHGGTPATPAYGAASTLDTQGKFNDDTAIAPGGTGTTGGTGNGGWTIHRTDDMSGSTFGRECDACHSPHRKSYDDTPALSYGRMLRIYSAQGDVASTPAYSTDAVPFGEKMCYECHGTGTSGVMDSFGGVGTYVATGGDHQAVYETTSAAGAAHNPSNVTYATRTRPNGGTLPKIGCLACHNKHASPVRALVDYRNSDTSTVAYDQSGLCFACHSAAGATAEKAAGTSVGGTNLAWNGRDVKSQFTVIGDPMGSGSRHPLSAVVPGPPQSESGTWLQTNQADFAADLTRVNVDVDTVPGSVQLAASGGGYVGSGSIQAGPIPAFSGTLDSWQTLVVNGDAPTDTTMTIGLYTSRTGLPPSAPLQSWRYTGPISVSLGTVPGLLASDLVYLRSDMVAKLVAPTPRTIVDDFNDNVFDTTAPAPAWIDALIGGAADPDSGATSNLKTITFATALLDATTGMDALNPSTNNAWTRNSNTGQGGLAGYARTGTSPASFTDHIMQENLGNLGGYASVNVSYYWRNSGTMSTGDSLVAEWSPTGAAPWTVLATHGSGSNTTWTPVVATALPKGSNCVLRFRATVANAANDNYRVDTVVIDGAGAPTNLWPGEAGGTLTVRAAGTDFSAQADQGGFVYLTDPGWFTGDFDLRVKVNSVQNTNAFAKAGVMIRTGGSPQAQNATMAGMYVSPGSGVSFQYRSATNVNTVASTAPGPTAPEYLRLVRSGTTVSGYYSNDGTSWTQQGTAQTIPWTGSVYVGMAVTSRVNATTFCDAVFDDFSVTEVVGGPVASVTPRLDDWSMGYMWTPAPTSAAGRVACVSCHNVHRVKKGTGAWDVARVSDPTDVTKSVTDVTTFCLRCHSGNAVLAKPADRTVPYDVLFTAVDTVTASPFFPLWDKSVTNLDFAGSAHNMQPLEGGKNAYTTCQTCHDPHASANARLVAWTRPHASPVDVAWTGTAPLDVDRANTRTVDAFEEHLCYKCHGNGVAADTGKAPTAPNVYTPALGLFDHGVSANGGTPLHSDTEGAADLGSANRHAECVDCHDPHAARPSTHAIGTSVADGALYGATGVMPQTWPAVGTNSAGTVGDPSGFVTRRLAGGTTDYEAALCFKCHSNYVTLPTLVNTTGSGSYAPTNIAWEFNPNQASGHNVLGRTWPKTTWTVVDINGVPRTPTWQFPTRGVFKVGAGYDATSMLKCTSCHTNSTAGNAVGPHGSAAKWLIDSSYTSDWKTAAYLTNATNGMNSTTIICAKCHDLLAGGGSSNTAHATGNHRDSTTGLCTNCHIRIPHGWKRPRLLGYTTDPAPYRTNAGALYKISTSVDHLVSGGQASWQQNNQCANPSGGCYDAEHGGSVTAVWP